MCLDVWPNAAVSGREDIMSKRLNWMERLVVIAIIAILLTLLMPSIQQAREMRRRAQWAADAQMLRQHVKTVPATPRVISPEVQEGPLLVGEFLVQGENGELWIVKVVILVPIERRSHENGSFARTQLL